MRRSRQSEWQCARALENARSLECFVELDDRGSRRTSVGHELRDRRVGKELFKRFARRPLVDDHNLALPSGELVAERTRRLPSLRGPVEKIALSLERRRAFATSPGTLIMTITLTTDSLLDDSDHTRRHGTGLPSRGSCRATSEHQSRRPQRSSHPKTLPARGLTERPTSGRDLGAHTRQAIIDNRAPEPSIYRDES